MPNTLVHLVINVTPVRALGRREDLPWAYAGAVAPDLPWILNRVVEEMPIALDPVAARAYFVVQSSLSMSLLMAIAAGLLVRQVRAFAVVGIGATLHLLIDGLQSKWTTGPLFFAPFGWQDSSWGLFSIESSFNVGLTLLGFMVGAAMLLSVPRLSLRLGPARVGALAVVMVVYLLLPLVWIDQAVATNQHYLDVLRPGAERIGRAVEIDRAAYRSQGSSEGEEGPLGEWFELSGPRPQDARTVSIRGTFIDVDTIEVLQFRVHHPWFRDAATLVGLVLVSVALILALLPGYHKGR